MSKKFTLSLALLTALTFISCNETSGDAARLEQSMDKIAAAVTAIADGSSAASPIVEEVETGDGGKMVILAFGNGDYQAWVVSPDGVIQGVGYQNGSKGYRLTPGGFTESR